jgi:glycosyltransferase involved in cell wall biosynthesis
MLSVIIPAYNEERTLASVIERVLASPLRPQVIVVSDGSCDATPQIIHRYQMQRGIVGLIQRTNAGKGAAIASALEWVTEPYTLIQDADLEYFPEDYPALLEAAMQRPGQVVYGSRNLRHPAARKNKFEYLRFWLGGKIVTLAANLLLGTRLTDEATCYKLFPTDLLRQMNLQSRGFDFCPEVTVKSIRLGYRIHEVPIRYAPRTLAAGKKIRAVDGIKAIAALIKHRWTPLASPIAPAVAPQAQGESILLRQAA